MDVVLPFEKWFNGLFGSLRFGFRFGFEEA